MPNWEYFERPSSLPHFTRIIGSNLFLRNLTSICVRSNYTGETFHELDDYGLECYQGFPFSFLLPFLALPSLQSAYITWAFDLNIAEEFVHTGLFSSNLKKPKLSHCAVHPRVLQDVMSRCIGLEVFVCHMPVSDWPVHELSKAMYLHRDSLRTIELDLCEWVYNDVETDGRGEWGATDDCYSKSFGFLTEYTALRNLTVSEDMLLQFSPDPMIDELLPSGLEKLHLNVCTASLLPSLESLLCLVGNRAVMPNLSKIRIDNWNPDLESRHKRYIINESRLERKAREIESTARLRRLGDGYKAAGIACSFGCSWSKQDWY